MCSRIHFLSTGHSDCIILQSGKKIAMIDAAEDTDNPRGFSSLELDGYEDVVVDYLLKNFSDDDGCVEIEFVLGTHCHSDHIGGFDTVINHPAISVKKAFLKPYKEEDIFIMERRCWDNTEVYKQMLDAIKANNVELIEDFDNLNIKLGDFDITFFNGKYKKRMIKYGENVNSVVTLVQAFGKKLLLVGDLNYKSGDEKVIADKVGKIDLLKVGHHGYVGSTSGYFAKKLSPEYSIVCNWSKNIYPDVKSKLTRIAGSEIIATADVNGVIAEVSDAGIKIITDIM